MTKIKNSKKFKIFVEELHWFPKTKIITYQLGYLKIQTKISKNLKKHCYYYPSILTNFAFILTIIHFISIKPRLNFKANFLINFKKKCYFFANFLKNYYLKFNLN